MIWNNWINSRSHLRDHIAIIIFERNSHPYIINKWNSLLIYNLDWRIIFIRDHLSVYIIAICDNLFSSQSLTFPPLSHKHLLIKSQIGWLIYFEFKSSARICKLKLCEVEPIKHDHNSLIHMLDHSTILHNTFDY